jgi:hypothetical protein
MISPFVQLPSKTKITSKNLCCSQQQHYAFAEVEKVLSHNPFNLNGKE